MIEARGLTKRFGQVTAVDGLTFSVRPGEVTGFLGRNGAGKTTTLRMILGLARPRQMREKLQDAVAGGTLVHLDAIDSGQVTCRCRASDSSGSQPRARSSHSPSLFAVRLGRSPHDRRKTYLRIALRSTPGTRTSRQRPARVPVHRYHVDHVERSPFHRPPSSAGAKISRLDDDQVNHDTHAVLVGIASLRMRRRETAGDYDLCVWVVIRPEGRVSRGLQASGGHAVTDLGDPGGAGFVPDTSTIATLCGAAVRALPVKGASVSVMVPAGHRGTVHATDPTAAAIDEWQFTLGEGPAVDAFEDGRPVLVSDLQDAALPYSRRWPAFTPAALDAGVRAVYALPQQFGAIRLGAFTLYHDEPGALSSGHLTRALQIADTTAVALLHLGHGASGPAGSGQAADGQLYRAEVYQASGMIRVQLGVSLEEAMIRLRALAFAEGRPVGDVARDIVARRLRLRQDNPGDNHESETEDE